LRGEVRAVGTFRYRADGCDGVFCRSMLVVREAEAAAALADMRGRTVAYSATDSQSGYNSLRALVAPLATHGRFFGASVASGSHRASLDMVREGRADIAAIDCVTLAGQHLNAPEAVHGLRVIGSTEPYPGLPLITAGSTGDEDLAAMRTVLCAAMRDPALQEVLRALLIEGFQSMELSDYAVCSEMRDRAIALGYPKL
jgi:ABC-type phosphate/phosphonate transport system substrate-binding protein